MTWRILLIALAGTAVVASACSKSVTESAVDSASAVGTKLMAPLVQKDASRQAEALAQRLADRPECEVYRNRLREAGKGPPAAGATQLAIVEAYQDAGKAGCGRTP